MAETYIWSALFIFFSSVQSDPCFYDNHKVLSSSGQRGTSCIPTGNGVCDYYLADGWYRAQNYDDIFPRQIHTESINMFRCGTTRPIWMNGSHPSIAEDIVNRTACSSGTISDCDFQYTIQVKNCTSFYVYYLRRTVGCEGYCFGSMCSEKDPCQQHNTIEDDGLRGTICERQKNNLCDDKLDNTWYRVKKDGVNLDIPQQALPMYSCGTTFPIWVNGSLPSQSVIQVNRKACVVGVSSTCKKFYNISIRNCSLFNVYKLTPTTECPERFCFGHTSDCTEEGHNLKVKSDKNLCGELCEILIGVLAAVILLVSAVLFITLGSSKVKCWSSKIAAEKIV